MHTVIRDSEIGDRTTIRQSTVHDSKLGTEVSVGHLHIFAQIQLLEMKCALETSWKSKTVLVIEVKLHT